MADELQALFEELLGTDPEAVEQVIKRDGNTVYIPFDPANYRFGVDEHCDFIAEKMGFLNRIKSDQHYFVMSAGQFQEIEYYWQEHLKPVAPTVEELLKEPEVELSDPEDFWANLNEVVDGVVQEETPTARTTDIKPDKRIKPEQENERE